MFAQVGNEFDLGFCIGLLEGEGSFHYTKSTYANCWLVRVACQMTDKEPLEKLQHLFGGNLNGPYSNNDLYKDTWYWAVGDKEEVLRICKYIYKYMSPRRKFQIEEVVRIILENPRKKAKIALHGTYSCYTGGCRCIECYTAQKEYRKNKKDTLVLV